MSEQSKVYKLTSRPQLIDLNADLVNFELDFLVKANQSQREFHAIVLTQEQLEGIDLNTVEMKTAKGQIGGNINASNNRYQNYFLVLKTSEEDVETEEGEEDFEVEVIIHLKSIDSVNPSPSSLELSNSNSLDIVESTPSVEIVTPFVPLYRRPWFWLCIVIIIFFLCIYLYRWSRQRSSRTSTSPVVRTTTVETVDMIPDTTNVQLYNQLRNQV